MSAISTSNRSAIGKVVLAVYCFAIAAYAVVAYSVMPLGSLVHPDMKANFVAHPIGIYGHIGGAAIALLIGPFQFFARLRSAVPNVHRWIGRVYLSIGGLGIGVFGLYMSQYAFGGTVARLGFGALAVCWLYSAARAYVAIRHRAIQKHRKWMVRNFALTFAAVTLRIYLPASALAGVEFEVAYPIIAWLAWVPNLLVAEWVFNTAKGSGRHPAPAATSLHSSDS